MSRESILLSLALLCGVCGVNVAFAESPMTERAAQSAWNDLGSTAAGLAMGAVEANPLGIAIIPIKVTVLEAMKEEENMAARVDGESRVTAIWNGAAANNLCIIAAILTGGALAPVCPFVGVAWIAKEWNDSEQDRWRAYQCEARRIASGNAQHDCKPIFVGAEVVPAEEIARAEQCHYRRHMANDKTLKC